MSRTLYFDAGYAFSPRAAMLEWLAAEGAQIREGQELFRYEIDKAVCAYPSPCSGWMRRHLVREGELFSHQAVVAVVSDGPEEELAHIWAEPSQPTLTDEFDWSEIDNRAGETVEMEPMRRVIARRMAMSKRHIPCFYLTVTVDMTGCQALRQGMRKTGRKATFNDMAIRASALAIARHPRMATIYLEGKVMHRTDINIGFAAALPDDGLVVPVVRNADQKSLVDIAGETRNLAGKAKSGELTPADCRGGIFSVSYLGSYEVDSFVAIVNPGESAIVAMGKTVDTPVVVDGKVEIRPIAKLTLSSDHRTIDGALAARFMTDLKALMENPETSL